MTVCVKLVAMTKQKSQDEKQRDEVLKKLLQTPPKKNKPIKEKESDKG